LRVTARNPLHGKLLDFSSQVATLVEEVRMKTAILIILGAFALTAFAQTSEPPTVGTTQTEDANGSVGDDTSAPAESTKDKVEKHEKKSKKAAKKKAKHHKKK
jgi:hypothetical protein